MSDTLDKLSIAAPCPADWNKMTGDDQVRFCDACKLNVYNIANMTQEEADKLVADKEGKLCLRLYKRKDGTVITENCPVGLRLLKRKLKWIAAGIATLFSGLGFFSLSQDNTVLGKICIPQHSQTLTNTKVIDGNTFHAGDDIYSEQGNELVSAEIHTDTNIKGIDCKTGDRVIFAENGKERYPCYIQFTEPRLLKNTAFNGFGKTVGVSLDNSGHLGEAICQGGPLSIDKIIFQGDKYVGFYANGIITKGYLFRSQIIDGLNLKHDTVVTFYESGKLKHGTLLHPQFINGMKCKDQFLLYENAKPRYVVLSGDQAVFGKSHKNGEWLQFKEDGTLLRSLPGPPQNWLRGAE